MHGSDPYCIVTAAKPCMSCFKCSRHLAPYACNLPQKHEHAAVVVAAVPLLMCLCFVALECWQGMCACKRLFAKLARIVVHLE